MTSTNPNHSDERQCTVRIPLTIYRRIERLAKKKRRSFNAQTVVVLEQGIGPAEKEDAGK